MLQSLSSMLFSAYTQVVILILMVAYFFGHRKDPRLVASGVNLLRTLILTVIFIYFMFFWASTVEPSLRGASVAGMVIINLYMLYNLVLTRLERPYRDALETFGREPQKPGHMEDIWQAGKKFFYADYFFSSLYSGDLPWVYLHDLAVDRIRTDIRKTLKQQGVEDRLTTMRTMMAYLRSQVDCDQEMPQDFKEVIDQSIEQFAKHPWIEEKVNQFLTLAIETPEDLNYPEWKDSWEKSITSS
jgi:hypothetical protein